MKQQIKDLKDSPLGIVADTWKVEAYKEGYKLGDSRCPRRRKKEAK
jgi:hypothetical protein